jgi:hypothetical protein
LQINQFNCEILELFLIEILTLRYCNLMMKSKRSGSFVVCSQNH